MMRSLLFSTIGSPLLVANEQGHREVLTTRYDGDIIFRVEPNGNGNYPLTTSEQYANIFT